MKKLTISLLASASLLVITSCGDHDTVIGKDLGDTSFVNEDFKGNNIEYATDMNVLGNLTAADIAEFYGVEEDKIKILSSHNSKSSFMNPNAQIYVMTGANDFEWLRGSLFLSKDQQPTDGADQGSDDEWQVYWNIRKNKRKSSEWVSDLGQVALWIGSKRSLEVKYDGYTLNLTVPGSAIQKEENELKRDYKSIAMSMLKKAGY